MNTSTFLLYLFLLSLAFCHAKPINTLNVQKRYESSDSSDDSSDSGETSGEAQLTTFPPPTQHISPFDLMKSTFAQLLHVI
uniref:Secreted protein n=1 Tax=Steinernema glaseri TaxID=37863 RepID=A0A1I7YLD4_9BILA